MVSRGVVGPYHAQAKEDILNQLAICADEVRYHSEDADLEAQQHQYRRQDQRLDVAGAVAAEVVVKKSIIYWQKNTEIERGRSKELLVSSRSLRMLWHKGYR